MPPPLKYKAHKCLPLTPDWRAVFKSTHTCANVHTVNWLVRGIYYNMMLQVHLQTRKLTSTVTEPRSWIILVYGLETTAFSALHPGPFSFCNCQLSSSYSLSLCLSTEEVESRAAFEHLNPCPLLKYKNEDGLLYLFVLCLLNLGNTDLTRR